MNQRLSDVFGEVPQRCFGSAAVLSPPICAVEVEMLLSEDAQ